LAYVPIENLLKHTNGNMYELVILASRRAQELGLGSEKLVETNTNTKLTTIALKEIELSKISRKAKKKS